MYLSRQAFQSAQQPGVVNASTSDSATKTRRTQLHRPQRRPSYAAAMPDVPPAPPTAPVVPHLRTVHGDVFQDDFAWMADTEHPDLLRYLEAENAFTAAAASGFEALTTQVYADISARTRQTDLSVPEFVRHQGLGDYWYYARTTQGNDYPSYHRCPARSRDEIPDPDQAPPVGEELLLDVQELAADADFFSLGVFTVSPDGRRGAYSVDTSGDERYRAHFLTLDGGSPIPDVITDVAAGGVWMGNEAFAYLRMDAAWRPHQVWSHRLGGEEALLFTEPDERFWVGVGTSRDHRWLLVQSAAKNTGETWLRDLHDPGGALVSVRPRQEGVEYEVEIAEDRLFIVHNLDAPDFALAQAPLPQPAAGDWEPIWAGEAGVRLLGVSAYQRVLVQVYRQNALQRVSLRYRDASGAVTAAVPIPTPDPLGEWDADDGDEPDTDRIRVHYQSLTTPDQVLEFHLDDQRLVLLRQREVLDHPDFGRYQPGDYVEKREWATAADGTRIPISIVHRLDLETPARFLLYGYGAYEISLGMGFSIPRLSLLDRGVGYAIAHVRGGGELGRSWYEQGRLEHKENTFTDFIACAHHLIKSGYTTAHQLAAEGGSAGGLLIGAVINQAPELFHAVHAAVPFVDPLTTMLDPTLPLTITERDEWGDPIADPQVYRLLQRYSPYENLHSGRYPALLVTASRNDTRVEITEPAKWVARLRQLTGSATLINLRTEMNSGHSGRSGRYRVWQDLAFELSWVMHQFAVQAPG